MDDVDDNDLSHRTDEPSDCMYLEGCPMFVRIQSHEVRAIWILEYCRGGEYSECVRLKLKRQGRTVPPDLLPDGSTIDE